MRCESKWLQLSWTFLSIGILQELVFTWVHSAVTEHNPDTDILQARFHDWRYGYGYLSVYYLPMYFLVPSSVLLALAETRFFRLSIWRRMLVYLVVYHTAEYLSMFGLSRLLGQSPNEHCYKAAAWSVHNFTRLDYAPAFAVSSLVMEQIFLAVTMND